MVMYIVLSTQEKQEIVKKMGPRLRGVNSEARANQDAGSRSRGPESRLFTYGEATQVNG